MYIKDWPICYRTYSFPLYHQYIACCNKNTVFISLLYSLNYNKKKHEITKVYPIKISDISNSVHYIVLVSLQDNSDNMILGY